MVKNIGVKEFSEMMTQDNSIVMDARTSNEVAGGVIPNAVNMDYMHPTFKQQIEDLDKSKKYLVYCHSGQRSYFAANVMVESGFEDVSNLQGGILGWAGEIVSYKG